MKDFNLSDKIITNAKFNINHNINCINVNDFIWKKDVKEFIKELKKKWMTDFIDYSEHTFNKDEYCKWIDELAGEKII